MNHRGGAALVRSLWLSWIQHRGFFFVLAFLWMIPPLIALFVWSAAAGDGSLAGLNRAEFAAYYLVLILVNQITYAQTNWTVGDVIRYGGLTPWLLRPILPIYNMLASEAAGKTVYLLFSVPVVLLLAVLLRPELHLSAANGLLFLPAMVLAWALRFLWGLWLAELAFWSTRADALLVIQDSLVFVFSGLVAPVVLLPETLRSWAALLPFRYMVGFPVEILTGQLGRAEILNGLAVQAAWLAAALAVSWLLWRAGAKRYTAIGS